MRHADIAIVGAGAAGLATAIFAARHNPAPLIVALDGARKLGAKILVSGGGRCNVTNVAVEPDDFRCDNPNPLRRVLRSFTAQQAAGFFRELGVGLHEEERGKLFPDSNSAGTVLAALVQEATARNVALLTGHRVLGIAPRAGAFELLTSAGRVHALRVVLATGGMSLPKTGSDGTGYEFARRLGHTIIPPVPALAPLELEGDFHASLAGVAHDVELAVQVEGERAVAVSGPMLWTHFGISGPAAMDASGAWERARAEGKRAAVAANLVPGRDFAAVERQLLQRAVEHPRERLPGALAELLPSRVAAAVAAHLAIPSDTQLAQLARQTRRRLVHALLAWPLPVRRSRGYTHAEVTAGGVPLREINPATMESRVCPGLFLVGEILNVDGRIGGFNFQWAWSTGYVAGSACAAF
ncbi:MAG: NAD(P)/FAD-dependent oxidoreductase [Planctomycetes bacterium]|nr:NAD(P)/FAD-dependent oxidoreductase [Planctomycetota bacterium]